MRQNIFITGASKGIGRQLAIEYARRGNTLYLSSRNTDRLQELTAILNSAGATAYYSQCNVTSPENVKSSFKDAIDKLHLIDIVILNAGISKTSYFKDFNIEEFKRVIDVNLYGVINCFDIALQYLLKQGFGKIVVISSIADSRGMPGSGSYNASKAAVSTVFESARAELAQHNIQLITVRPGFIKTDLTSKNKFPMPFLMDVEKAAKIIINGIDKSKKVISFPFPMTTLTTLLKILPASVYDFASKNIISPYRKKSE